MIKRGWLILFFFLMLANFAFASEEILEENERKILEFDDKRIDISIIVISEKENSVVLKANNEVFQLRPSETFETKDFIIVLRAIIPSLKTTQKSIARVFISPIGVQISRTETKVTTEYEISGELLNINPYYYNLQTKKTSFIESRDIEHEMQFIEEEIEVENPIEVKKSESGSWQKIEVEEKPETIKQKKEFNYLLIFVLLVIIIIAILLKKKFRRQIKRHFKL